jgi:hypothetical protein
MMHLIQTHHGSRTPAMEEYAPPPRRGHWARLILLAFLVILAGYAIAHGLSKAQAAAQQHSAVKAE